MVGCNTDSEIEHLLGFITRLGSEGKGGELGVKFKTLFDDDEVSNTLECLAGTLKAAKKKKIIDYDSELLLQGVSDNVMIRVLKDPQ